MDLNGTKHNYVVGIKQTLKAVAQHEAAVCYVAKDADSNLTEDVIKACSQNAVPVEFIDTKKELGHKFRINVGAACGAELK